MAQSPTDLKTGRAARFRRLGAYTETT